MRVERVFFFVIIAGAVACASSQSSIADAMPDVAGGEVSLNGIRYIDLAVGTGDSTIRQHCVYAQYTGWRSGGRKIDSSRDPMPNGSAGEPVGFVLGVNEAMRGWDIGFAGMRVGGRRRLLIPAAYAYGEQGRPPLVPPNAALVFDVELMRVGKASVSPGGTCIAWRGLRPND